MVLGLQGRNLGERDTVQPITSIFFPVFIPLAFSSFITVLSHSNDRGHPYGVSDFKGNVANVSPLNRWIFVGL